MKILLVVPYPIGQAPSQRFRFEQYLSFFKELDWEYRLASFLDEETWHILYKPGQTVAKALGIIKGFLRRFQLLFSVPAYDYVFIHREATPIGPPWFEWVVAKVLRKKIIFDFDDAIWIPNTSENNKIIAGIKWHHKVSAICKWAYKVSCGNSYLRDYAGQFNSRAVINPTTIDTINLHNQVKDQHTSKIVIGWTGTHSTMKYLEQVVPVLQKLEEDYAFEFRVISNQKPDLPVRSLVFKPWQKETEIADLIAFNVGLMPLEDDPWAKGKCAFKALQYMALGIPALVSPVGMNTEVVNSKVDGFICSTKEEWYTALEFLLLTPEARVSMGQAAREKIQSNYAVTANKENFLSLFE